MNDNLCPQCQHELIWNGGYHCDHCDLDFKKVGFCPDCGAEMEKLAACGATNYFCNQCNELKSKSRVRFEFQIIR